MKLSGAFTALITPFSNNKIDFDKFKELLDWQISEGINGVVVAGTTGETPTFEMEEYKKLIDVSISQVNKRAPLIVGTGFSDTSKTISLTQYAEKAGADYALVVVPYYNRPSERGVYEHFKHIHDQTNIPIIIYDIPFRTGLSISIDLIIKLAELPRIVGIKDSTFDLSRISKTKAHVKCDFVFLSGDDETFLSYLAQGGQGVISVSSNIIPNEIAQICKLFFEKDIYNAQKIFLGFNKLRRALFCESSPVGVKYAASKMGLCKSDVRLPHIELEEKNKKLIDETLTSYEMI